MDPEFLRTLERQDERSGKEERFLHPCKVWIRGKGQFNRASRMEGVWLTEGVWTLADYGGLELLQKNKALQRQKMESQLPTFP